MRRSTLTWAVLSALLWAGVGAFGAYAFLEGRDATGPEAEAEELAASLQEILDREQYRQLAEILEKHREEVKNAEQEFGQKLRELRSTADSRIEQLLREDQRQPYLDLTLGGS